MDRGDNRGTISSRLAGVRIFAAANVLKYVRRHQAKNGEDDLAKARWYAEQLGVMSGANPRGDAMLTLAKLCVLLTQDEIALLSRHPS